MWAVQTKALTRTFEPERRERRHRSTVTALDAVDFVVDTGEIHGLLGPNGAGKTTLVRILATILLPTAGTAAVLGRDVVAETAQVRQDIGLVFGGDRGLYGRLTARQNLEYWGALYDVPPADVAGRINQLLDRVGLTERANDRVETYSRGMRQRLHMARGLVGSPRILFLDEPTIGLDPVAARSFRDLLLELREEGVTIVLTTHDMAEAEAVCDRVSLIDKGKIVATEQTKTLGRWISQYERVDAKDVNDNLRGRLSQIPGVSAVEVLSDGQTRISVDAEGTTSQVLDMLVQSGVTSINTSVPSLEEVYVHILGNRGMEL